MKTKTLKKTVLLTVILLGFAATSSAQSFTFIAKAEVLKAITLTNVVDFDFGRFFSVVAAGTITISDADVVTSTGVNLIGGGRTAAKFTINGTINGNVTVVHAATATLTSPGGAMTLNLNAPLSQTVTLGSTGTATVAIGGTLAVGSNQPSGNYNSDATFVVTMSYQ